VFFGREYTKHAAELDADPSAGAREVARSRDLASRRRPLLVRIVVFGAAAAMLVLMVAVLAEFFWGR